MTRRPQDLSPWERAAMHALERLLYRENRIDDGRRLLAMIEDDEIPEDDNGLRAILQPLGVDLDEVYAEQDALLYLNGARVYLPGNPCPNALRLADNTPDPKRERPCVLHAGHGGPSCRFADVPLRRQRASSLQFRAEVAAVERALSGATTH